MTEYLPPEDDVDRLIQRAQIANAPAECARIREEITLIAKRVYADLDATKRKLAEARKIEQILAQSPDLRLAKELDRLKIQCADHQGREERLQRKNEALLAENAELRKSAQQLLATNSTLLEKVRELRKTSKVKSPGKTKEHKKSKTAKASKRALRRVTLDDAKRRVLKS